MTSAVTPVRAAKAGVRDSMSRLLSTIIASSRLTFVVLWAALALASIAWGVTTPLGASPDEPAHIVKAASVVRGQFIGEATSLPAVTRVDVPVGLSEASRWPCYAFNPAIGAQCIKPIDSGFRLHTATTSAGLYNPVYYAIVGLPSLVIPDTQTAVLAMRALSGILSAFFLAFAFAILLRLIRPAIAGAVFFTAVTPMVLFLSGAVNPNSLEISTGAALTVGLLYVVLDGRGPRHSFVLGIVAVAGFLMANTRGISPLWMALIGIGVLVVSPWARTKYLLSRRATLVALGVMIAGVLCAASWLLSTGTLSSMGVFPGAGSTTPQTAFREMLVNHTIDPGLIGVFGWLDTPLSPIVYFVWSGLIAAVLFSVIALARGRAFLAFLFSLAALLLTPPIVQALSVEKSGYIWQGRYTLVALVFTLLFAGVALGRSPLVDTIASAVTRRFVLVVGATIFLGQLFGLTSAMNRYSGHAGSSYPSFLLSATWVPPGGSVVWFGLFVVGIAVPLAIWHASCRVLPDTVDSSAG